MNTKISYLYRDGTNCKAPRDVVVAGKISFHDIAGCLDEGVWFIASQVGLPDAQLYFATVPEWNFPNDNDHVWCELDEGDFESTEEDPTVKVTASQLKEAFKKAKEEGWDVDSAVTRLSEAA